MKFTSRTGIKVLVVVIGVGAGGIVAERHLAASPSPVNSVKADSPPRVELARPEVTVKGERGPGDKLGKRGRVVGHGAHPSRFRPSRGNRHPRPQRVAHGLFGR